MARAVRRLQGRGPGGCKALTSGLSLSRHHLRWGSPVPKIWIDGKFYEKEDAKISVFDHGLLYGDGVF